MGIFIFFENGYVCFVVRHGSVIQSKYIILLFYFLLRMGMLYVGM